MIRTFTSAASPPRERGLEFGEVHADEVRRTVEAYRPLIDLGRADVLPAIRGAAPELALEIEGIATGAGVPVDELAAVNARTELLAVAARGECSTVVAFPDGGGAPLAMQTWDWFGALADSWLVWTIPQPDGRVVRTLTEYGIVGKIGVNGHGLGLLFNILHHADDGGALGVPVHVLARRALDRAHDVTSALALLTSARVSASTCMTLVDARNAVSVELSPAGADAVLPSADGLLLHTNHFLADRGRPGCRELEVGPDSHVRLDTLRRAIRSEADVPAALEAVRCPPDDEYQTLATIALDVAAGDLRVHTPTTTWSLT